MIDKFVLYRRFTSTTQQRWQKRSPPWWNCRTGSFVGPLPAWGLCFSWRYDFVEILIFFREKKKLQDELNQLSRNCLTDVQSRFWSSDQHAKILCNARDHFLLKVFWPKRHLPRWSPVALLAATEEALHLWRLQHCCHVIENPIISKSNKFLLQAKPHNLRKGGKTVRTKGRRVLNRACSSSGDNDNDLYIIGAVCLSQKRLFCPTKPSRTFRNLLEPSGTFRNLPEPSRTF